MPAPEAVDAFLNLQKRDRVFENRTGAFRFDAEVAEVFDDMANRSIPLYRDLQMLIAAIVGHDLPANATIVDLGCSTGTTIGLLAKTLQRPDIKFVGLDASAEMLDKARVKATQHAFEVTLAHQNFDTQISIPTCDVAILNLSLQFVTPTQRLPLINAIFDALTPGGRLILVEKTAPKPATAPLATATYHAYKKANGYSEAEITHKQTALQNILIPWSEIENKRALREASFSTITPFFQWLMFKGWIAFKPR